MQVQLLLQSVALAHVEASADESMQLLRECLKKRTLLLRRVSLAHVDLSADEPVNLQNERTPAGCSIRLYCLV